MGKNTELGLTGAGVEAIEIPEIEKAISKYQRKKQARCEASPGEIEAKRELAEILHTHREKLPVNGDGVPFYRSDDRDYLLLETLKVRRVDTDDEDED
jgi:hypothetical protein